MKKMNGRAKFLLGIFWILFGLLITRFVYIQTVKEVNGENLLEIAEKRWTEQHVIEGKRGTIFDRAGDILAEEIPSYTIVAILDEKQNNRVKDPRYTAEQLATVVNRPVEDLEKMLSQEGKVQVELGSGTKNLSLEKMKEIESLNLEGITFRKEPKRYYPKQNFASHVIGYTERDMSKARMGLESSLNDYLVQDDGKIKYLSDRKGFKLPNLDEIVDPPKNGHDAYLTIDSNIQLALEQVMSQVEEQYTPERIMAIVADPKTGEILAMSNRPSFNPNFYEEIVNYTNYNVSSRFEPGSTMKVFTLAAAIEEGIYNGNETYKSGSYKIGARTIRDHNRGLGWGEITFDEGFQRSSNVAYSILALEKLKPERFYSYLERFGFRNPTGIDLPNEATSLIADKYLTDAATTAFGQASAVTPIQQIQAMTAIANGGKMMRPYIIDKIVENTTGHVVMQAEPYQVGTPISEQTAKHVLELMESVVTAPSGTGKPYYIEGFEVAGKTGTGEIPDPDGPGYLSGQNEYIYSFIGAAPKSDPKLVVYVAVDRPKLEAHEKGSTPVSLIFNTVMKHSLQYLKIKPSDLNNDEDQKNGGNLIVDYTNKAVGEVQSELAAKGVDVVVIGDGSKVIGQVPAAGLKVMEGEKVLVKTDGENYQMPNIIGWSLRDVMKLSDLLTLDSHFIGSGYAIKQSIPPGSEIRDGAYILIQLLVPSIEFDENTEEDVDQTLNMN